MEQSGCLGESGLLEFEVPVLVGTLTMHVPRIATAAAFMMNLELCRMLQVGGCAF